MKRLGVEIDKTGKVSPTQMLEMRNNLIAQYGKKIIFGDTKQMTAEEQAASVMYKTLSEELHKAAPDTVGSDKMYELYMKYDADNIFQLLINYPMTKFKSLFRS